MVAKPVHRITLVFSGRTEAEIHRIMAALQARAREHGGFMGAFVEDRGELDADSDGRLSED